MKIGFLTFHIPHNYGAVLQAFSLQKVFEKLGYDNEIIDFRRKRQIDYTSLYPARHGMKSKVKNTLLIPFHFGRKKRADKFQDFIENKLVKSRDTYTNEEQLSVCNELYDTFFIGSDQVWNTKKEADKSSAYFLDFVDDSNKKRFAYAPSIGIAEEKDLSEYKSMLEKFAMISCREQRGAEVLSKLLNRNVPVVLDPTLIVETEYLKELIKKDNSEPYIFYYSLDGFDKRKRNMDILSYFSKRYGYKVKMITPEWLYHFRTGKQISNAGIEDFLSLIYNAEFVCTNSFHGTALSVVLNKPFYVLEERGGNDDRKQSLLRALHLENRIVPSISDAKNTADYHMVYDSVNVELNKLREKSLEFLKECLQ